jgi:hypothetical protein
VRAGPELSNKHLGLPLDIRPLVRFLLVEGVWVKFLNIVGLFPSHVHSPHDDMEPFPNKLLNFCRVIWTTMNIDTPLLHPFVVLFHPRVFSSFELFLND